MLAKLNNPDWQSVFHFAGTEAGCNSPSRPPERALPNDLDTSVSPFAREDVAEILGIEEGENEGPDWLICGRLHDGRYFAIRAGCDFTGWG